MGLPKTESWSEGPDAAPAAGATEAPADEAACPAVAGSRLSDVDADVEAGWGVGSPECALLSYSRRG